MMATTICVVDVFHVGARCLEDGHELKEIEAAVQHVSQSTETAESVFPGVALPT